jgi:hypothetical protein
MQKGFFILFLTLVLNSVDGQTVLSGQYQTNFPAYGMFAETLDLNCDSTFALNFRGDLQNDNTFGSWTVNKRSVILTIDTIRTKTKRYSGPITFNIKGDRLYQKKLTKKEYKILQQKIAEHNKVTKDTLGLPKFAAFQMTPKNHSGKEGRQFYKKLKAFSCKS